MCICRCVRVVCVSVFGDGLASVAHAVLMMFGCVYLRGCVGVEVVGWCELRVLEGVHMRMCVLWESG